MDVTPGFALAPPALLWPFTGLTGAQRLALGLVGLLCLFVPVLVLFFTRRPKDPRLHEGCGDVMPAIVPAVALWATSLYAARVAVTVLNSPGWLRTSLTVGGPTFIVLPLLVAGLFLAANPTRPTVAAFAAVGALTLLFDAWLMQLPTSVTPYSVYFSPNLVVKVLLYAVLWVAAAPLPLIVLAIPMILLYLVYFGVNLLRGRVD